MVHPIKTPLGAARAITHLSISAVRHPVRTASDVVTLGRELVGSVTGRSPGTVSSVVESGDPVAQPAPSTSSETVKKQGDPLADGTRPSGQTEDQHDQVVTEPSPVTGPGDADEIPSPAVQPSDEDIEVTTPVGTTGAGPGVNPDTTESDLQQPGTEPLMDPSTTKRVKSETETLRKASERRKD